MRNMQNTNQNAEKYAWENFSKTGQIGYYLLYRALTYGETDGHNDQGNSHTENGVS